MGFPSFRKICASSFHNRRLLFQDRGFCRVYYGVNAMLLDYHTSSESDNSVVDELRVLPAFSCTQLEKEPSNHFIRHMYPGWSRVESLSLIVKVLKTLNWRIGRKLLFSKVVKRYEFSDSVDAVKILVHTVAEAEMLDILYCLLRDAVLYYKRANYDVFELSRSLFVQSRSMGVVVDELIKVFAANSMLENALDVFVEARISKCIPSISACNFLLKCLAEARIDNSLKDVFDEMKHFGPLPNVYTYTIMVNYYCSQSNGKEDYSVEALRLLEEMSGDGICPSVVTYCTYIQGLCRMGRVEIASKFLYDLACNQSPLNCYTYNAVIHGFCRRKRIREALRVFEDMKCTAIAPDVYTYGILINAFCKKGDALKGFSLMKEMVSNKFVPSAFCYNSLIHGFSKKGMLKEAIEIYSCMLKRCILPDIYSYNFLIDGCLKAGRVEGALKLVNKMMDQGMVPNRVTYNAFIDKWCKAGESKRGLEWFPVMLKRHVFPGVFSYSTIIDGLAKESKLREALDLYNTMLRVGINPDVVACTIRINIYCQKKKMHVVERLSKECQRPDTIFYTSIIVGYFRIKDMEKATSMYREMRQRGLKRTLLTYTCLLDGYLKSGRVDLVDSLIDVMKIKGIVFDIVTYSVLVAGFRRLGKQDRAEEFLKEMKKEGVLPDEIAYRVLGLDDGISTKI